MDDIDDQIDRIHWHGDRVAADDIRDNLRGMMDPSLVIREECFSELHEYLMAQHEQIVPDAAHIVPVLYQMATEGDHGRAYAALLLCCIARTAVRSDASKVLEALRAGLPTAQSWAGKPMEDARDYLRQWAAASGGEPAHEDDLDEIWESLCEHEEKDALIGATPKSIRKWCGGDPLIGDCAASVMVEDLATFVLSLGREERGEVLAGCQEPEQLDEKRLGNAEEQAHRMLFADHLRWKLDTEPVHSLHAGHEGYQRAAARWIEACATRDVGFAAHVLASVTSPYSRPVFRRLKALVLAASGDTEAARTVAVELAREWLGPAVTGAANQSLTRDDVADLLLRFPSDSETKQLYDAIISAPDPDVAVPDDDVL